VAHGYVALLLAGLIALHVVAALDHQFVGKDRLFRRMWFGQRFSGPGPRSPGSGELTSGPVITSR
jgi:cytochrome b561